MRGLRAWGLGVAALLMSSAFAAPLPAEDPGPQISVVTFAPGEVYWQRFGHNALLVREAGTAQLYNYGIFDFQQKNFFLNFARGRMQYRLDVAPLEWALRPYYAEGRWALEQRLALTPAQSRELAALLAWNAQPENAEYRYDYFLANCSTKVRDALDQVLGGALRAQLEAQAGSGGSFRSEVLSLMAPVPALHLGMDLALGARVNAPLTAWQEAFIPMRLMVALREVRIADADGVPRPLVLGESSLAPQSVNETPLAAPTSPWAPMLIVGLLLAVGIAGLRALRGNAAARLALRAASGLIALSFGLAGLVLLLGWLVTEHWGMAANRNLLLLSPLWWALLPALWRSARPDAPLPGPKTRGIALLLLMLALAAPLSAAFGPQPNLHWIALLLPVQGVLLGALLRPKPQQPSA